MHWSVPQLDFAWWRPSWLRHSFFFVVCFVWVHNAALNPLCFVVLRSFFEARQGKLKMKNFPKRIYSARRSHFLHLYVSKTRVNKVNNQQLNFASSAHAKNFVCFCNNATFSSTFEIFQFLMCVFRTPFNSTLNYFTQWVPSQNNSRPHLQ